MTGICHFCSEFVRKPNESADNSRPPPPPPPYIHHHHCARVCYTSCWHPKCFSIFGFLFYLLDTFQWTKTNAMLNETARHEANATLFFVVVVAIIDKGNCHHHHHRRQYHCSCRCVVIFFCDIINYMGTTLPFIADWARNSIKLEIYFYFYDGYALAEKAANGFFVKTLNN